MCVSKNTSWRLDRVKTTCINCCCIFIPVVFLFLSLKGFKIIRISFNLSFPKFALLCIFLSLQIYFSILSWAYLQWSWLQWNRFNQTFQNWNFRYNSIPDICKTIYVLNGREKLKEWANINTLRYILEGCSSRRQIGGI